MTDQQLIDTLIEMLRDLSLSNKSYYDRMLHIEEQLKAANTRNHQLQDITSLYRTENELLKSENASLKLERQELFDMVLRTSQEVSLPAAAEIPRD
jgi:tRNA splicing endonuclease